MISFTDRASFRCGVCYEFSVYDLEQSKQHWYMQKIKSYYRQFDGDFTLLWPNSSFDGSHIGEKSTIFLVNYKNSQF